MNYPEFDSNAGELRGRKTISRYIRGGKGAVTLVSPTGKYHSYQFRYPASKQRGEFPNGTMFVYVMVGRRIWQYVGMLKHDRKFYHTKASQFGVKSEEFKGAIFIVSMMNEEKHTSMKLYHQGICSVCGRKLTTPKSIECGMGPRCMTRVQQLSQGLI